MDRKNSIIKFIENSKNPVTGTFIASIFNVSRQVIVQDIALIRASGIDIISTNKGYVINKKNVFKEVIKVVHQEADIEDELTTIVDLGGSVIDCIVKHEMYGELNVVLNISSRNDIKTFLINLNENNNQPLMKITNDVHFHTIEAKDLNTLNLIKEELKFKKYLIE